MVHLVCTVLYCALGIGARSRHTNVMCTAGRAAVGTVLPLAGRCCTLLHQRGGAWCLALQLEAAASGLPAGTHGAPHVCGMRVTHLLHVQGRMYTLPDVWIRPNFGGKGRKVTGQLEAHSNGFRYSSPKGETLDIMFR